MSKRAKVFGIVGTTLLLVFGTGAGAWYYYWYYQKPRHSPTRQAQVISLAPFVLSIPRRSGGSGYIDIEMSLGVEGAKIIDKTALEHMMPELRASLLSVMMDYPDVASLPYSAQDRKAITAQIIRAAGPMFGKNTQVTGVYITKLVEE